MKIWFRSFVETLDYLAGGWKCKGILHALDSVLKHSDAPPAGRHLVEAVLVEAGQGRNVSDSMAQIRHRRCCTLVLCQASPLGEISEGFEDRASC